MNVIFNIKEKLSSISDSFIDSAKQLSSFFINQLIIIQKVLFAFFLVMLLCKNNFWR